MSNECTVLAETYNTLYVSETYNILYVSGTSYQIYILLIAIQSLFSFILGILDFFIWYLNKIHDVNNDARLIV